MYKTNKIPDLSNVTEYSVNIKISLVNFYLLGRKHRELQNFVRRNEKWPK
jgi:hypothetical protein